MINRYNIFLAVVVIMLLGFWLSLSITPIQLENITHEKKHPSYIGNTVSITNFTIDGNKHYDFYAKTVNFFNYDQHTEFKNADIFLYDSKSINSTHPMWQLKSPQASLSKEKLLSASKNVVIDALAKDSKLKKLNLQDALVNLNNYDVTSNSEVEMFGDNFISTGSKLAGNLNTQYAKLLENVKVHYEILKK